MSLGLLSCWKIHLRQSFSLLAVFDKQWHNIHTKNDTSQTVLDILSNSSNKTFLQPALFLNLQILKETQNTKWFTFLWKCIASKYLPTNAWMTLTLIYNFLNDPVVKVAISQYYWKVIDPNTDSQRYCAHWYHLGVDSDSCFCCQWKSQIQQYVLSVR